MRRKTAARPWRRPRSPIRTALLVLLLAGRSEAQVDPSGPWRTLHTEHFRIHFRPAYRDVALTEAREAERAYALLATQLHPPRGIVDLTLGDDIDGSNGFTTVFPSSRVTILAPAPATDPGLLQYDTWLRLVTTHELAHVFHLDRTKSVWAVAQHVLGRAPGLFPNEYQPIWLVEGLATYYESRFTNGGRVRGSFHTQLLAADRAAGAARSPWDAEPFTRWSDGLVPYAYGSRFLQFLAATAGDSAVPRLVEATAAQLIPFRVGRQLERVAPGCTLPGLWPRGTEPAAAPGAPAVGMRVIDSLLRTEPVPSVSPDGHRIAYLADDGKGASELRVLDGETLHGIASHAVNGNVSYGWSGDTLIVAQLDYTARWRLRSDLYGWTPGGAWHRETRGARLTQPAGRSVAIELRPGANRPTVPAPADPGGGGGGGGGGATWEAVVPSPDGRWIAGTRNAAGRWSLVRWPTDSPAAAVSLVESRSVVADPVWTSRGALWFVADPSGFPQVYAWHDEGGGGGGVAQALTAEPLGARSPAPLPDGTLLYSALTAGGWELRRAPPLADGARARFSDPLAFDSAPPLRVPARETGYALWPSLRPHFWIPFFLNAGPTGQFGGGVTAGTDALQRFTYAADLLVSPHPFRVRGDVVLVTDLLGNPRLDFSASSAWLDVAAPPGVTLSELNQTAAIGVAFVRRRWRSLASLRFAAELERFRYAATPDTALAVVCPGCLARDVIGGSATLGLSRVVAGVLSVSPEDGFAWSLTYRRRDERGSARWSNELRSQLALYAHVPGLGGFAHHALALRLAAGGIDGSLGSRYQVGGVSSGSIALSFGQSLGVRRLFPIRGYRYGEMVGERAATGTVEYRLPLALVGHSLGHLPVGADRVWLNAFADAGDAWDPGTAPRLTRLRSAGLELAGAVTVAYNLFVQLRLGMAEPLAAPPSGAARRASAYLAFASDF